MVPSYVADRVPPIGTPESPTRVYEPLAIVAVSVFEGQSS